MSMQKPKKLPRDANSLAARIVAISTGQDMELNKPTTVPKGEKEKNPAAVEGSLGVHGKMRDNCSRGRGIKLAARSQRDDPDEQDKGPKGTSVSSHDELNDEENKGLERHSLTLMKPDT
jgi:hypothetical protein